MAIIAIIFNNYSNDWKSQEEMKTMCMQNCLRVLGVKKHVNKVYNGGCGNGEWLRLTQSLMICQRFCVQCNQI